MSELWVPARFTQPWKVVAAVLLGALVAYGYVWRLGTNPFGTFTDEALIGVQAKRLIEGELEFGSFGLFYNHYETVAGMLPVYATAPFVWVLGLNDFSLRLASVFYVAVTFGVLWLTFRRLKIASPWLPVLIFALSPITIHIGRVNFGHTPALFLMALGYWFYITGRDRLNLPLSLLGGVAIGASAYGYPGFYLATPLFVGVIVLGELLFRRLSKQRLAHTAAVAVGAVLCYLPILREMRANPMFMARFEDKDTLDAGLVSFERAELMLWNYQKYFGLDFLFEVGESGMPNQPIQRHSVIGAGELSWVTLPILAFALLAFVFVRGGALKRAFAPFFLLAVLFPLPDLVSTRSSIPAYAFTMFTCVLLVPFVAAYGLEVLAEYRDGSVRQEHHAGNFNPFAIIGRRLISTPVITAAVAVAGFFFVFATYAKYPEASSGYWGWQAGPRDMIAYFTEHHEQYDQFIMEGTFNNPDIFLDFYIDDPEVRVKAVVGGFDQRRIAGDQLFAFSRETYDTQALASEWIIQDVIYYPDDTVAFYLLEHVRDDPGVRELP